MDWVQRLADSVGWQSINLDIAWPQIEERLGTELPSDFKQFCQCFGIGEFSGYLEVSSSTGGEDLKILTVRNYLLSMFNDHPTLPETYEPYGFYRAGGGGLIQWGISVNADEFFWLAQPGVDPSMWGVVARHEVGEWQEFDMSMSEFTYRMLNDVQFEDFTVADVVSPPTYESHAHTPPGKIG